MLRAFTAGLLLITISELGDKTFFIAVILAMRHSRRLVLTAVIAALASMTLLSVLIGQVVSLFPEKYLNFGEIALFIGFGLKLIYDASKMPNKSDEAVVKEAAEAIEEEPKKNNFITNFLAKYPHLALWFQAFSLTFVAEWGDRTQISTIALASTYNPIGVTVGAIIGHSICTVIAVVGGKLIAGRLSEKMITFIGGILFLIFGVVAAIE